MIAAIQDALYNFPRGWHPASPLSPWKEGLLCPSPPSHQLQGQSPCGWGVTWFTSPLMTLGWISPSCLQGPRLPDVPLKPTCPPLPVTMLRCLHQLPAWLSFCPCGQGPFPWSLSWVLQPSAVLLPLRSVAITALHARCLLPITYFGAGSVGSSAQLRSMQVLGTLAHSKHLRWSRGDCFSLVVPEMLWTSSLVSHDGRLQVLH